VQRRFPLSNRVCGSKACSATRSKRVSRSRAGRRGADRRARQPAGERPAPGLLGLVRHGPAWGSAARYGRLAGSSSVRCARPVPRRRVGSPTRRPGSAQGLANSFCRYAGSSPASLAMASSVSLGGASFWNRLPCQVLPLSLHWQKKSGLSVPYTTFFSNR
jgi:hypothetical protein